MGEQIAPQGELDPTPAVKSPAHGRKTFAIPLRTVAQFAISCVFRLHTYPEPLVHQLFLGIVPHKPRARLH